MADSPTLSFCITCKNRFHQIEQTLKQNLDDNHMHGDFIEFVLVDFGSTDGLREWVLSNFKNELDTGFLRYYYTEEMTYWNASVAKNTAHLLAKNDILVNLDCDNYTGYEGGQFVIERFVNNRMDIVLHQYGGNRYDGSYGRISVLKKHFYTIGGYDESFEPMGYQDKDLFMRLEAAGLLYFLASDIRYNQAIANNKEESLINTGSSKKFREMLNHNQEKSEQNIKNGKLIANNGVFGIRENLYDHHGKLREIESDTFSRFAKVDFPSVEPVIFNNSSGSIPKIIHQVWEGKTEPVPYHFAQLAETWKVHYPHWHYEFWDGRKMDNFIETYYPQYAEAYRNFPYHVQRWDAIRYMILNKIGGMYIDFDYESIEPLDELIKDKTCCFALEPESHCRIFRKPVMFNNAMMLSVPGHPFMEKVIETVFSDDWQKSATEAAMAYPDEKRRKNYIVLNTTGPWMLIDLYHQLPENEKDEVYLIPDKYVTPFSVAQARMVIHGNETEELENRLEEAYAVHYFFGMWKNDEP